MSRKRSRKNPILAPNPETFNSLQKERQNLPIYEARDQILAEIKSNNSIVIVGETGSGKTTQLPQYLLEEGLVQKGLMLGITQPRRVAAVTVAKRVADERGAKLGCEVGYSVRFDDMTSRQTRIKFLTDGMLLREALIDPSLSSYGYIIIDEAHERSLHSDLLLALLRKIQQKDLERQALTETSANDGSETKDSIQTTKSSQRTDPLKIIVMSATLQAEQFANFFGGKVVYVRGRLHQVDVFYTNEPQSDFLEAAFISTLQIHLQEGPGDILVFLTGRDDIETLEKLLLSKRKDIPPGVSDYRIVPIFSGLPSELQLRAFEVSEKSTRKIILATNIAETSITIPGIRYVIDTGLAKARGYNPITEVDSLLVLPISKSAARQRSGRAGRDGPGKAYRLYTEAAYWEMSNYGIPEIKRCRLDEALLQLKAIGVEDLNSLEYFEPPPLEGLKKGAKRLLLLGALDKQGKLTKDGKLMAGLPVDPRSAKAILVASKKECLKEVISIIALLENDTLFYSGGAEKKAKASRSQFETPEGDLLMLLNVWRAYQKVPAKKREEWCRQNFLNSKTLAKATEVQAQLKEYCQNISLWGSESGEKDDSLVDLETEISPEKKNAIAASFTAGYFQQTARCEGNSYNGLSEKKEEIHLHPTCSLFGKQPRPEWVIYIDLVLTTKLYMRDVFVVEPEMLSAEAPHFFKMST